MTYTYTHAIETHVPPDAVLGEGAGVIAAEQPETRFGAPKQSPGFLLWRTTLAWQRQIRQALAPYELTHVQFVLLASLWWLTDHRDGEPTQTGLADHAGTDPMMTSQVLRKLEARGLVVRTQHPRDSRARELHLTRNGAILVTQGLAAVEAADEEYFSALDNRRRRTLIDALQSLGRRRAGGRAGSNS